MRNIRTRQQLEEWARENGCFEDGFVASVAPAPSADKLPEEVRWVFRVPACGEFGAGQHVTFEDTPVLAKGVTVWRCDPDVDDYLGVLIEGIDIPEGKNNIALEIPDLGLLLECEELQVDRPSSVEIVIRPWVSDMCIHASIRAASIPTPAQWVSWTDDAGLDVAWRRYAGQAVPPEHVPYPDYCGWYLQVCHEIVVETDRPTKAQGVSFVLVDREEDIVRLGVSREHDSDDHLWRVVTSIIARMPGSRISSGNCLLSGPEWIAYLEAGELPARLTERHG